MQIKIKAIGHKTGTVGWLRSGLETGTLELTEGTLTGNGNHCLFLHGRGENKLSQFLAAKNQYAFEPGEVLNHPELLGYCPSEGDTDREHIWTDAAWAVLMEIAAQWCTELNAERAADADAGEAIKIKRVEITTETPQ